MLIFFYYYYSKFCLECQRKCEHLFSFLRFHLNHQNFFRILNYACRHSFNTHLNPNRRPPSNLNLTFMWKSRCDAATSKHHSSFWSHVPEIWEVMLICYSQLWISAVSARWLHSFVWRWWRARAATLPRRAENESLDCSWTLKPLNVERRRRLQLLRPCLHFCLSLNPTFLLWGIFEKRAERGFSVLLMQPPTREQRIPDTLYLFSLVLSHLMKNTLAFFSLIWQALHFTTFQFHLFYSHFSNRHECFIWACWCPPAGMQWNKKKKNHSAFSDCKVSELICCKLDISSTSCISLGHNREPNSSLRRFKTDTKISDSNLVNLS